MYSVKYRNESVASRQHSLCFMFADKLLSLCFFFSVKMSNFAQKIKKVWKIWIGQILASDTEKPIIMSVAVIVTASGAK